MSDQPAQFETLPEPLLDENYLLGLWARSRDGGDIAREETVAALEAIRITRKIALKLIYEQ